VVETPNDPAIVGTETLAMVISKISMNVDNEAAIVSKPNANPCNGAGATGGEAVTAFTSDWLR
jgi:hypothetical protein